ncbi:hypothetical protein HYH02_003403 [Chlamydomonas schloesseri]|uniref:tRNA pseudouridine(55) synthase n=1 Tax=Chlamydomonas schloesseri TaxID=2026947 RepID=A0A835WQH9_9CHLO|nr:hypothetical protein HYH02_003403 [Chlamydomonas schloesseri]|eukprot:KAG2451622.1 hypothetical protein HYH02_003403 [Chlamydomonas schloesseri]
MTSFPEHLRPEVLANGVLLVDKPQHWEVPEVVAAVQRATGMDKVASVAPLDAAASGLMLLCFGAATRLAARVERAAKRYTGTLVLGGASLSGDVRGSSYKAAQMPVEHLTDEDLVEVAQGLVTVAGGSTRRPLHVLPLSRRLRQLPSSSEYYEECVEPSVRTTEMELLDFRVWREAAPASTHSNWVTADALYCPLDSQAHRAQSEDGLEQLPRLNQVLSSSLAEEQSQQRPAARSEVVLRFSARMAGRSHVRSLVAMYGKRLRTTACLDELRRTHVGAFDVEEAWALEALVPVLQRHRR